LSQYFELHPVNPQLRLIRRAADIVRAGGVIAYPTDSCYALGCHIGDKSALERVRRIRQADRHHHFTLVCRDVGESARFARIDTPQFRLLKACTPGPYTFLLPATRETPRRLQHERRRTIGIRVPDHPVPRMLLAELGEPLMSSTLIIPGDARWWQLRHRADDGRGSRGDAADHRAPREGRYRALCANFNIIPPCPHRGPQRGPRVSIP
jgi:tRNA threonylcarbamoyl adenosine modification protein (Sua5/YciO/YrdC/YwlC family)